ncbi:helix-turn-helix domain-containing protein [Streptomyces sp. NBC_00893]|nr:helix-turn-helix domain-containing protein [Streptomyces sp. NBC_00893]
MPVRAARPTAPSAAETRAVEEDGLRHRTEYRLRVRAQVVLHAARGRSNARIARETGLHLDTVRRWCDRFADGHRHGESAAEHPLAGPGAERIRTRARWQHDRRPGDADARQGTHCGVPAPAVGRGGPGGAGAVPSPARRPRAQAAYLPRSHRPSAERAGGGAADPYRSHDPTGRVLTG